jgi:type II secretory pathway pseudopilin PulG
MTLVELAVTSAIAVMILSGVATAVGDGLQVRTQVLQQDDAAAQAAFAMERMVAGVRAAVPPAAGTPLSAAVPGSTGTWLPQVTYAWGAAAGTLTETVGTSVSVIADHVTAFSASLHTTSPASGAVYAHPVIDLALTVTADSGQSATVQSTTRMGGGTR